MGSSIVSWSDLLFFCEMEGKICHMSYGMQRNPPHYAPFFCLFYHEMVFPSRHSVDMLLYASTLCYYEMTTCMYETNLHICLESKSCITISPIGVKFVQFCLALQIFFHISLTSSTSIFLYFIIFHGKGFEYYVWTLPFPLHVDVVTILLANQLSRFRFQQPIASAS